MENEFTSIQFEALAYIFEKANGNTNSQYEKEIIEKSGLIKFEPDILERKVIIGLENKIYSTSDKISAYWVLGKRFNYNLIPLFQKWLKKECDLGDAYAVYQLLISLGNMEEPVFNPNRKGSSASNEIELNTRDARNYLNTIDN